MWTVLLTLSLDLWACPGLTEGRGQLLTDGFHIREVPEDVRSQDFSPLIEMLPIQPRERKVRECSNPESNPSWTSLRALHEWGRQVIQKQLGRGVPKVKQGILIREGVGYRKAHVHTDPAQVTLIFQLEGDAEEGTWAVPFEKVFRGGIWNWLFFQPARRATRRERRFDGDFVRRADLVQSRGNIEALFVMGHLAREVLGDRAAVGFHTAPFTPRKRNRTVAATVYDLGITDP